MAVNIGLPFLLSVRWVMLRAVGAGSGLGVSDAMCHDVVRAAYAQADMDLIRRELDYLEAAGLVSLARSEVDPWRATLTREGRDVVDYTTDAPQGIARPPYSPI